MCIHFFATVPAPLILMAGRSIIDKEFTVRNGSHVSVTCDNSNTRPGYTGKPLWTNVEERMDSAPHILDLIAIASVAGTYECTVPNAPAIALRTFNLIVQCKLHQGQVCTSQMNRTLVRDGILPCTKLNFSLHFFRKYRLFCFNNE